MSSVETASTQVPAPVVERRLFGPAAAVAARQLRSEFRLVFGRRRNMAMLIVLAAIPIVIGSAVKLSAPRPDGGGPAFIGEMTGNGLFLALAALTNCLPVLLPLAVAVVAGDSVAGEANIGTLRYLLTVPVSRTRLLVVKSLGALGYLAASILIVAAVGIIAGLALFGGHGVTLLSGDTVSFADGLLRAAGVCVFVFVDLLGLAAIAIFLSTLIEAPIGAMAGTVAAVITFTVFDSVPQFGGIRGLLLTHHWLGYSSLLRRDVSLTALAHDLVVPVSYAVIFFRLAWVKLTSAAVTS